ncbi:A4/G1 family peptidase [Aspergillus thermomutatus]|uniref:Aspergillopepsin-2 n=1 Tax=Aspergillus thermomutatus TaxID=41047 RepID=A0A397GG81_ASPTH|nr:uncharacterized protein CDV56_104662 [Aspergillus thermomutatus]RHZ48406.1 hypothetical protein CDV56_104662 [Aspergillus thermomutatus]
MRLFGLSTLIIAVGSRLFTEAQATPNQRLLKRVEAHQHSHYYRSRPIKHAIAEPKMENMTSMTTDQKNTYYSSNWAGVALLNSNLPSTPALTSVAATLTVPVPTSSSTNVQAASAWVGIDGFINTAAILQTGIDIVAYKGEPGCYTAWYEWYPDSAVDFDLTIDAGDVVVATVYSTSDSTGVAIIQNESTGESATATLRAPQSTATLTGQSAEWIVEDYQSGGSTVSFSDFGTVTFTGVVAGAEGNQTFGVEGDGAAVVDILSGNSIVAEGSIISSSEITVQCTTPSVVAVLGNTRPKITELDLGEPAVALLVVNEDIVKFDI